MSTKHLSGIRKFNRAILNPISRLFAGKYYYSLVIHTGRSSGKEYTTPVVATIKDGFIFIPLPYGTDTDWFLNIKAKGECVVKINGKSYPAINPQPVEPATAFPAFPVSYRKTFTRLNIQQFLQLSIQ